MKNPPSFFWQIESLWEKAIRAEQQKKTRKMIDFSSLTEKYLLSNKSFTLQQNPDFTPSQNNIFIDEHGEGFRGLQSFSLCFQGSKPIYFVDNHQNALIPFFDFFQTTNTPISIVHIDAHRDDAIFPHKISTEKTNQNLEDILQKCRVSDYLDAGKKMGIIKKKISYTQSNEFENFSLPNTPYILNLDIDIYGPEGSAVDTALKTKVIAKAWHHAEMVCFATSPAFIDQELAGKIGKILYTTL